MTQAEGQYMRRRMIYLLFLLLSLSAAAQQEKKDIEELRTKGKPSPAAIGHYRLELCISDDHQFCALQLFRFVDFKNSPVFEPRFYEGSDAEFFVNLL